jgi:glycosyltransferase involved in cell wall biosynthesis
MVEQLGAFPPGHAVQEFILEGAERVTQAPVVIPYERRALGAAWWKKPVARYGDLRRLEQAWRSLSREVLAHSVDIVWANPCAELQVPPLDQRLAQRSVLYLDEPARQYFDVAVRRSTRPATRPLYFLLNLRKRTLQVKVAKTYARMVTNSSFTASMISRAYGCDAEVVPLGVHERFHPSSSSPSADFVLSVGTLIPSKGHDLVLKALAASKLPLALRVIAPRESQTERQRLRELAEEYNVDLELRVGVSDRELVHAYQNAAVTVYAATAEPFGLVSLEAQACGCPLVLVNEGGLPETAHGNPMVVLSEREVGALAAAILRAVEPVSAATRAAAASDASRSWGWARSSERLVDAFAEVARS